MIKAVIFDCGRVFLHDPDNEVIFEDMAQSCHLPYSKVETVINELIPYYQKGELTDETFWQTFQQRTGLQKLPDDYQELWTRRYLEFERIDYEVLDLVKKLRDGNYITAVLSNTIPPHVRVNRERELFGLFNYEIFSCEVGFRKPETRIYEVALRLCQVSPSEAVYIDDILKYVEAPKRELGVEGLLFEGLVKLKGDLQTLGIKIQ